MLDWILSQGFDAGFENLSMAYDLRLEGLHLNLDSCRVLSAGLCHMRLQI